MGAKAARAPQKKKGTSLFPLILGQSVGLDTRFGDQIAYLIVGRVKSRTRNGVGGRSRGREVAKGRDELTVRKAVQSDILSMLINPTHQNKKNIKNEG